MSPGFRGGGSLHRRGATAALAGLLAALAMGAGADAQGVPARGELDRRNVLVVMTDDQRVSDLTRAMPRTKSHFGSSGVSFRRAFATFPLCCPSRATYLTGQYAHNHGVVSNHPPDGGMQAFDDSATTAVALDAAGYETGWVGKYLNGYFPFGRQVPPYVPPGFDWWRVPPTPRVSYGWEQVIDDHLRSWGNADRDYMDDVFARQAENFVEAAAGTGLPFFLTVAPRAPHIETRTFRPRHNPRGAHRHRRAFTSQRLPRPASFNEADVSDKPSFIAGLPRLDRRKREALRDLNRDRLRTLLAVDDLVVRVIRALRRTGQLDETLVIFTSDNGFLLGEHRMQGKSSVYDPSSKVPLLMRGPGINPGTVVGSPVGNIDIAATIYDFTGVEPAAEQDGVSLIDVASLPEVFADRELVLQTGRGAALRTSDWLYGEYETELGEERELYDLQADRHQLESLHDDPAHAPVRAELAARLAELRTCEGDECR